MEVKNNKILFNSKNWFKLKFKFAPLIFNSLDISINDCARLQIKPSTLISHFLINFYRTQKATITMLRQYHILRNTMNE